MDGYWLSVSALAAARNVSKQAISRNLKRWSDAGAEVKTRKEGRALLVNVAEYDRVKGEVGDAARELGERTKKETPTALDNSYTREQARAKGYDAELKRLELEERLKSLVRTDKVRNATVVCGEATVRVIGQLATKADEIAAAVAKDGVVGARAMLKQIAHDMRARLADEFAKISVAAMNDGEDVQDDED